MLLFRDVIKIENEPSIQATDFTFSPILQRSFA